MTKSAASFDFAHLDPMDHEDEVDIDDVDLERFLDLDDSAEIADLVTAMRAEPSAELPEAGREPAEPPLRAAAPVAEPVRPVPVAPARGGFGLAARRGTRTARTAGVRAAAATEAEVRAPHGPPAAGNGAADARGVTAPGRSPVRRQSGPVPKPTSAQAPHAAAPLDLVAIARALGKVHLQGRQLVVTCPACAGRAAIVIYANRFKCFGCEANGEESALVRLLTGWDARRVAAWLADARVSTEAAADTRRPWRLSLFAR
jgi:hypothetical protein